MDLSAAAAPVLVFDSGVGGLSILARIQQRLPTAAFVYAMDGAGYPYGVRDDGELAARIPALLGRLVERYRPRLAVIACNTASTIAIDAVRSALEIPVVGTVPAVKTAAARSNSRVIGVLGTNATVRQRYLDRLIADFASDCTLLRHGAPALVDLAEARVRGDDRPSSAAADALAGLVDQTHGSRMDTVVLACTHFAFVEAELAAAGGFKLSFIDSRDAVADRVCSLTHDQPWPNHRPEGIAIDTRANRSTQELSTALHRFGLSRLDSL